MIRVTELLQWGGLISPLPDTPVIAEALKRGTAVHQWSVKLDSTPQSEWEKLLEELAPAYRSFGQALIKFHRATAPVWTWREVRLSDEELGLTGCPDRYGTINEKCVVLDYKTGSSQSWHKIQLALYEILLNKKSQSVDSRLCVTLSKSGDYKIHTHNSKTDLILAWDLLNRWRKHSELNAPSDTMVSISSSHS